MKYGSRALIDVTEAGQHLVASVEPLEGEPGAGELRDEFCNEVFSATARQMRGGLVAAQSGIADDCAAPWALLAPFGEGASLPLGWSIESLSPIRAGAATLVLVHAEHGRARVAIRRNGGAPLGVAHTGALDLMLLNGGSGGARTEESVGRVLIVLAQALEAQPSTVAAARFIAALRPHAEAPTVPALGGDGAPGRRVVPRIDVAERTVIFVIDESGTSRLALYDAVLRFADRCFVFLARPAAESIELRLRVRGEATSDALKALAADVTRALNRVGRRGGRRGSRAGLPELPPERITDVDALVRELAAADPLTLGVGYRPERGPGHEDLRVLNIRGTGACNSDCIFCVEKFDPAHRVMPRTDTTRQLILANADRFDMLFFANGEPTIHPKLFDHVELARSAGFTSFGMSSHFRTFADPAFALRVLRAGFEYFDISLHAADVDGQSLVNPIGDRGASLPEALKGLAVLYALAEALGIRISVTHKIVVSRLNVTALEAVFRATYDRGVRHFIIQPVRAMNLDPDRQALLAIGEDEILPHLNAFLARTAGLGATVKPYGFSRRHLFTAAHVETEHNRVKNVYGRAHNVSMQRQRQLAEEERPRDGRHWVEVRMSDTGYRFRFASAGEAPVLDEALERGHELPFGCRMGSCGMCCARLLEGEVDQSGQFFLSEAQRRDGYVVLCQARAKSDLVVRLCTDDELDPL
ncbi:MAG: 2Fe-2S iron-sulfur cluster-binding protein [Myxococcales bacterium]|nr:2Fe-2S iron-sulfur cluster-binding protein [Myxococcales bacterium]